MTPLRRYLVDDNYEALWICELSESEVLLMSGRVEPREGEALAVLDPEPKYRAARENMERISHWAAKVKRSADLADMLNRELDKARLLVFDGIQPENAAAIRALHNALITSRG